MSSPDISLIKIVCTLPFTSLEIVEVVRLGLSLGPSILISSPELELIKTFCITPATDL